MIWISEYQRGAMWNSDFNFTVNRRWLNLHLELAGASKLVTAEINKWKKTQIWIKNSTAARKEGNERKMKMKKFVKSYLKTWQVVGTEIVLGKTIIS